ncbi:ankyrin repeat domain-containing protein, partial [Porphyromonas sp.]
NAKDLYFRTALHCATIEDDLNSVSRLVSLGAIIDAQDKDGNTPLFFAIRYRVSPAITDFLLTHGASLTIRNNYGVKPIDLMKD